MAKRALLIGVNEYRMGNNLSGCVNDVTNMRSILKTYFGFENADIRVLVNDRATKSNIEHRLKRMVDDSKKEDVLFIHFSGHGSQIRDRNGDEELEDQMDELICPHDMDWDGTYITDDHLNKIFQPLAAGAHLEVVLDCCHSGTGLRNPDLLRPPELGPKHPILVRRLVPPVDIQCRFEGEEERLNTFRFSKLASTKPSRILWAACKDYQTSADAYIEEKQAYNGAFTYYLCDHIRRLGGQVNREELLKRVHITLRYKGFDQVPQLEYDATTRANTFESRMTQPTHQAGRAKTQKSRTTKKKSR